jgi:hypothetical protein
MITKQKCNICDEMHEIVMHSPQSRYFKICLDCYVKTDQQNEKDFGKPKTQKNYGTHNPEKLN